VPTEFALRAGISSGGMAPEILTQSAEQVAEAGYRGLMQGRRTVVPGLVNKAVVVAIRLIPRRFLLALVDARQRRRRPAPRT
jgi:short-subunit dehydrogenase